MNLLIGLLLAAATTTTTPRLPVEKTLPPAVERMPIYLQTDANDVLGAIYVERLRDALAGSDAYRPVTIPANARFLVGVLTMDPNEGEAGSGTGGATVAAVTLQLQNPAGLNQFVYSWVLVAKRDKVDALATELLAAIDKEIRDLEGTSLER